jgi:altronate hydrolase
MAQISNLSSSTGSRGTMPLNEVAVLLHPDDDVIIAKSQLFPRTTLTRDDGDDIVIARMVPPGHKVACRPVTEGNPVRRYGQIIGFASSDIAPGQHVHSHNIEVHQGELEHDYGFGEDVQPVDFVPEDQRRTFMGYRRKDGRVGTRNYVAVLATVNCSSTATRRVADHFRHSDVMKQFPNVDGVLGFPTKGGCGAHYGSPDLGQLQRTMANIVDHPNVAAYVILSLGCEINQPDDMIAATHLSDNGHKPLVLTIQQDGGFQKTVEAGIEAVMELLPAANALEREEVPASELMLALQCGGSDGWSGVTANPALGKAADEIVRQGGTVVLGETSEVYGGEHILTRRAASREVGEKLVERIHWWEQYTSMFGASIDNNPTPGNKLGGLSTIYEKSLGAIAKAGSTPLNDVVPYAERITTKGFVHMDTPGYDPVSVTGQVAGGCNVVTFTTGRGSAFGFKPAPSLKLATNSDLYANQEPDMDINTGKVLDGVSLDEMGQEIFEAILAMASGNKSKSELADIGEEEFNPWIIGAML